MNQRFIKAILMTAFVAGCVRAPPPAELEEARATYKRVSTGPAAQHNPSGVADAKEALAKAETLYEDHVYDVSRPADYAIRDQAYVANRKAQLAEIQAHAALDAQEKARLEKELADARSRDKGKKDGDAAARAAAEEARRKLADIATVKQEDRGTVLTLAGNIVFATGQYKLRPDALSKLDKVVIALKEMPGKGIVIEGHTDATGADAMNQKLSQQRAATVRQYLIRRGIDKSQVQAVGKGKENPIGSNETSEGRASNRRVEIIVQPKS